MDQFFRVAAMQFNDWKIPLNVAIGLHVLILLSALYLPSIFQTKPKFADIYSVSIVNIAEPTVGPPPSAKTQKATPPSPAKVQKKATPPPVAAPKKPAQKIAPIAEKQEKIVPAEEVAAPQKAVSLKPLKKKIIQETKPQTKPPENQARKQEIERNQRQKLAAALREEELLQEQAKLAQEALEAERELLQMQQQVASSARAASSAASGERSSTSAASTGSNNNILENQYLAAVFNRLHQFWTPPEYLQQKPNLTTVVVITINADGTIANTLFESKSGDRVFDQFVSKTIEIAAPMPPIPPAMKKQRFEIGLRFRPGSIQ